MESGSNLLKRFFSGETAKPDRTTLDLTRSYDRRHGVDEIVEKLGESGLKDVSLKGNDINDPAFG
eukprot:CAMPEP_0196743224 /NCGR_PEP_ID=MMETSP1091-20130531/51538_1 /TAXON_ID=302021 /ORGANISM="Rhodomonas sp., Strain CCMP768" /LENGTH=64 /DNA_ID=CAMNT_0042089517 /DNA_START=50 /DNA_END=240 /DNA_ORIENTATION=+